MYSRVWGGVAEELGVGQWAMGNGQWEVGVGSRRSRREGA